jgi:hypothetical protein
MRESLDRRASRSSTCSHSTQRGSADVASLHSQQESLDISNHSHQASPVLESGGSFTGGSFSSGEEPSNPWQRRAEHRRRNLQVQHCCALVHVPIIRAVVISRNVGVSREVCSCALHDQLVCNACRQSGARRGGRC